MCLGVARERVDGLAIVVPVLPATREGGTRDARACEVGQIPAYLMGAWVLPSHDALLNARASVFCCVRSQFLRAPRR